MRAAIAVIAIVVVSACLLAFGLYRRAASPPDAGAPGGTIQQAMLGVEGGVFKVGIPEYGTGTAFLISRPRRLLATNAHIADIMARAVLNRKEPVRVKWEGERQTFLAEDPADPTSVLVAIPNGSARQYRVSRVYYHPGVLRQPRQVAGEPFPGRDPRAAAPLIPAQNPGIGDVVPFCPDVAVLELEAGGPELPEALTLAGWDEIRSLESKAVSIIGFPLGRGGYWPGPGEPVDATCLAGQFKVATDFTRRPASSPNEAQFVEHTTENDFGFSGSPLVLENGHVAAVHTLAAGSPYGVRIEWHFLKS